MITISYSQKTEIGMSFNSGLFSFGGQSAVRTSFINYNKQTKSGYTNDPYGSKGGLCYGFSGNIKRLTRKNFVYGIDIGFEQLRSKVSINQIIEFPDSTSNYYSSTGRTFLNCNFINLNPFIGYKFGSGKIKYEITGGFDMAYGLSTKEEGKAISTNGIEYSTAVDQKND